VALPTESPPQRVLDKQKTVEQEPLPPSPQKPVVELAPLIPPTVAVVPPVQVMPPTVAVAPLPMQEAPPVKVAPQMEEAPPKVAAPSFHVPPPVAPAAPEALPVPTPPLLPVTDRPPMPAAPLASQVPPVKMPPVVEETVEVAPAPEQPRIFVQHPGDSPMLRNWKQFGVTTLLTFAFSGQIPAAHDGPEGDGKPKTLEEKLYAYYKDIIKQFGDGREEVNKLRTEIKDLQKEVQDLKKDSKVELNLVVARMEKLETQLIGMKGEMDKLKISGSKAYYPPEQQDLINELKALLSAQHQELKELCSSLRQVLTKSSPQPQITTSTTGELILVNRYTEEVTLKINGADQGRIPSNSSRVIKGLPAGPVTYEIISSWGTSGVRRSNITPGDPLRVNVQ